MATSEINYLGDYIKRKAFSNDSLSGESNLNWVSQSGLYVFNTSTEGRPTNSSYGIVVHFHILSSDNMGWHWQLAFSTENRVYVRCNINSTLSNFGGNWSAWKEL